MKHHNLIAVSLACCLALGALALSGCACSRSSDDTTGSSGSSAVVKEQSASGSSGSSSAENEGSSSTTEESIVNATEIGSGNTTVEVKNATGYDISGVSVKVSSEEDYPADNSFDGFLYANGLTVKLSFTADDAVASYDVLLTTKDDSLIAVRDIDLVNAKDITFHFDNGIGYITYTDASSGETVDTEESAQQSEQDSANDSDSSNYDLENQAG
jgi:hypothetical protein